MIITKRLELRPATTALLMAELRGAAALAVELQATVPSSWPPELYDDHATRWALGMLERGERDAERYLLYYFLESGVAGGPSAVGLGGFKGPPVDGRVEIGYSILAEHRRRGLASEAVGGLIGFAFEDGRVDEVVAETFPHLVASLGVLEKHRFRLVGESAAEPGAVRYALGREAWKAMQRRR